MRNKEREIYEMAIETKKPNKHVFQKKLEDLKNNNFLYNFNR